MDIFSFIKFMIIEEHKQIQELLDKMSDEDLNFSIGSDTLGKRLLHMTGAEYRMASYLFEIEGDEMSEVKLTIPGFKSAFELSKNRHIMTIENLTLPDLDKDWISKQSGKSYQYKWLIYHFIEHLATHRGQVSMALRMSKENQD